MHRVPFSIANNWLWHPRLWRPVPWRTSSGNNHIQFEAGIGSSLWAIRMNNFPDEPCYTVLIDGEEVMHFDNWPWMWTRPEFPKSKGKHDYVA
jgi:hypothetical protein